MFLIFIFLFSFFTKPAFAANEFNVNENITYNVEKNGSASVNQEINLVNNLSEIYPKEFQLKLSGTDIKNIKAIDNLGNILKKMEQNNNEFDIHLEFNEENIGKDKITKFNLLYTIPKFAIHKGSTWEIILPEFDNINDNDIVDLNLITPSSFGNLSFSSINSPNISYLNNQTQIHLKNVKNKKILFAFGNYQIFDFNLKYFLENPKNYAISTEIAIPPQTESQNVVLDNINPPPQNITVDSDGNWLAQYQLKAMEKLEINVSGQSKIFSPTTYPIEIDTKNFIQEKKFWPVNNPKILKISQNFKGIKEIYDYVVDKLNYNFEKTDSVKRKGAIEALLSPNDSVCTEFTDLFVTLARSKKIPAREIEGFAFTNNSKIKPITSASDIIHAWPQYYDTNKKIWISVDPTWEKTTNGIDYFHDLDLNHFVFVIHGNNSEYPFPPGSYKDNQNTKTIDVSFASNEKKETFDSPKITFKNNFFKQTSKITIQNPNPNAINDINISIPNKNWKQKIKTIPPFSFSELDIPLVKNISLDFQNNQSPTIFENPNSLFFLFSNVFTTIIVLILILSGIILSIYKKIKK